MQTENGGTWQVCHPPTHSGVSVLIQIVGKCWWGTPPSVSADLFISKGHKTYNSHNKYDVLSQLLEKFFFVLFYCHNASYSVDGIHVKPLSTHTSAYVF